MSTIKEYTTLKYTKEFTLVYNKSCKVWHNPLFVVFYKRGTEKKVGFVASKKIGNAVARNRAKRILRAHFIEYYETLRGGSYVFVAKQELLRKPYRSRRALFEKALSNVIQTN